jgi:PAS domain S-box-containing protein
MATWLARRSKLDQEALMKKSLPAAVHVDAAAPGQIDTVVGETFNILLVEDDDLDAELILAELESGGISCYTRRVESDAEFRTAIAGPIQIDVILCDYGLPDLDALRALEQLKAAGLTTPLIVVSGRLSDERATDCIRLGAADYVIKDRLHRLPHAINRAILHERGERAGREAERRYSRLINDLPVAVFGATVDGRILHANPAMIAMFGCADLTEMTAISLADLHVDPTDRDLLIQRLDAEEQILNFECRMRRLDGSEFWFSRDVHAVRASDGALAEIESIGRDISEAKRSSLELAKSEERLRGLLVGAPVAIVTLDVDSRFTFAGGSVFTRLGLDPESIVGLAVTEAFADRPDFMDLWKRALVENVETDLEFGGRTFQVRCQPYRLSTGAAPIGVLVVAVDDTDRAEADRALRASEEVFRALFDQSSVGIALLDVPTDGDNGNARWNSRMREMMGVDGVDYATWASVFDGDTGAELLAKYMALLSGEVDQIRERREFVRPDGTSVWADLSTIVVRNAEHEAVRWQSLALDITDQVVAEQLLASRAARESVLLELTRAGLDGQPTSTFLEQAVRLVVGGTGTQFGTILEMQPSGMDMERVAAHAASGLVPPEVAPLDVSPVGAEMLKTMLRTAVISDFIAEPETPRAPWMVEANVACSMSVGIYGLTSPFGVLSVHADTAHQFTSDDLQFIQHAAGIIAIAVERRRNEEQRRLLLGRLVTAQEAERKSIAGDIHDDAVQVMTAANMRLELFRRLLVDQTQVDALKTLQDTVSLATARLRNLLFELNPPDLERHGLAVALRRHLKQFQENTSVRWVLQDDLVTEPQAEPRILLFRIFQEALANISKHAHSSEVSVSLKPSEGGVLMRVADNGAGFHVSGGPAVPGHLGLASMRERAEIAGGWWRLSSEPGLGTEITAWVPTPAGFDGLAPRDEWVVKVA